MKPCLIGLDWGTSSFRAYLIGEDHQIIDKISTSKGIQNKGSLEFDDVLEDSIGQWLENYPKTFLIASGMIGSRQGWKEAPYVNCPASLNDLASHLEVVRTKQGRDLWLVPGIKIDQPNTAPDVMRGEETQIFGALRTSLDSHYFVLPGTHSKWVVVEQGKIIWFSTFMTGEIFNLLWQHSILGKLITGEESEDENSFLRGIENSQVSNAGDGGILKKLFSARTLNLFDELPTSGVKSYLSGLLIGTELQNAPLPPNKQTKIHIIAESRLSNLYAEAMKQFGLNPKTVIGEPVVKGLALVAEQSRIQIK